MTIVDGLTIGDYHGLTLVEREVWGVDLTDEPRWENDCRCLDCPYLTREQGDDDAAAERVRWRGEYHAADTGHRVEWRWWGHEVSGGEPEIISTGGTS